jgi:hypothetical protein
VKPSELWETGGLPSWSQHGRQLRVDPGVQVWVADAVRREAAISHLEIVQPPTKAGATIFFSASLSGQPVVIKVGLTGRELHWLGILSARDPTLVPEVFAAGSSLDGEDLPWAVLERLPNHFEPRWEGNDAAMMEAAARWQLATKDLPGDNAFIVDETEVRGLITRWADSSVPAPREAVVDRLLADWAFVLEHCVLENTFGDLHYGNAMTRTLPPEQRAVLFDPIPRFAPWPFDAAYFEVLCGRSGVDNVRLLAESRHKRGLSVPEPAVIERLGILFRAWMALMWWDIGPFMRSDPAWAPRVRDLVHALLALPAR